MDRGTLEHSALTSHARKPPARVPPRPHRAAAARHAAGGDPQLLHHRPHRPRQVDPGRPDAADHRGRRRPLDARAVPRPDGHRARARHHHQEPGRADAVGPRRRTPRAQHDRHPGARRLHLRGQPQPRRLRGRGAARRRGAGHRGADAGEPLPRDGERAHDHPGAQQDRPAGSAAREVRGGARQADRLRARRLLPRVRQDRRRGRAAARRDRPADPVALGRRQRPGPRDDLRLGLRHLPRCGHLRAGHRRQPQPARADHHDVDPGHPRAARDRRHQPRAGPGQGPGRRRGRLPDHRREGRAPEPGRRHGDQPRQARQHRPRRLPRPEADGLLGAVPPRRLRLPRPARGPRQAQAQRRRARLRAGDLGGAGLRLPVRLPGPAAPRDRARAARARVRPRARSRPSPTSSTRWRWTTAPRSS